MYIQYNEDWIGKLSNPAVNRKVNIGIYGKVPEEMRKVPEDLK